MHIPKNYFHDRLVLLLLTINTFLALMGSILILLKLDSGRTDVYTVQFRANLGLESFKTGGPSEIISFMLFAVFVLIFHSVLSMRAYHIRRHFSIAVLGLATLLLALAIIVSNALLLLR